MDILRKSIQRYLEKQSKGMKSRFYFLCVWAMFWVDHKMEGVQGTSVVQFCCLHCIKFLALILLSYIDIGDCCQGSVWNKDTLWFNKKDHTLFNIDSGFYKLPGETWFWFQTAGCDNLLGRESLEDGLVQKPH